jgi:hypothetical protein
MQKRNGKIVSEEDEIGEMPPRNARGSHSSSLSLSVSEACDRFFEKRGMLQPTTWHRRGKAKEPKCS